MVLKAELKSTKSILTYVLRCSSLKLNSTDLLYPESYRINSPDESRLLDIADNFQLCVHDSSALDHRPPEPFSWPGCASFVADFLSLEPLEPPVNLVRNVKH
ncbi:hypothetical protein VZT92_014849 [Zoarces viviparus]|uniref:Uncharacterized protein n=1 Tax=Zoarces viviparus TaxID=48416 RepID=A0AAW1EY94_ZOAVI